MNGSRTSPGAWTLLATGCVIVLIAMTLTPITQWVTSWVCSPVPTPIGVFAGGEVVFSGTTEQWSGDPSCTPPVALVRTVVIALLALIIATGITVTVWVIRYRQSDTYFIRDLQMRAGFAGAGEVHKWFGPKAVLQRGARLRPSLTRPSADDVSVSVGTSRRSDVRLTVEDSVAVIGPPRSGKGRRLLISLIADYPGSVVTTSTRNDNLSITLGARRRLGEVSVFDPQQMSGLTGTAQWSPIIGCHDPLVASQRGQALIGGTALGRSTSNQEWGQTAGDILALLLHAAAVGGRGVDSLYEWGSSPQLARSAVEILRSDGTPGWAEDLEATLNGDPQLLSSKWFGVAGAVGPLRIPSVRAAMSPEPGRNFDLDEFAANRNTLYLLGTGTGAGAAGGFLGCLMDSITERARRTAQRKPEGRLDPPMGLILDEIVNIFPWAALPQLMADGGGSGIQPIVVLQALSQAEKVWSRADAETIWSAATAKVVLGGASDPDFLGDVEKLLGQRKHVQRSRSWNEGGTSQSTQESMRAVLTADEVRRMPETLGLMLYRNRRGVLLNLRSWTDRADAAEIHADRRATTALQRQTFHDLDAAEEVRSE